METVRFRPPRQKVIMIGDAYTGKSSLVLRYLTKEYDENFLTATIGIHHTSVDLSSSDEYNVRYDIWDTGGVERYRSVMALHYRGAHVVVLVYDITSESTFRTVKTVWRQELLYHVPEAQVILVGAKCDLSDRRVVSTERGKALATKYGYQFIETSSVTGYNVDTLFLGIACTLSSMVNKYSLELDDKIIRVPLKPAFLEEQEKPTEKSSCCVMC